MTTLTTTISRTHCHMWTHTHTQRKNVKESCESMINVILYIYI